MNIALVMCGKHKKRGFHQARNLYTSERFQRNFREASKMCEKVFILSAKHGLLKPKKYIWNYDRSLDDLFSKERLNWSQKVVQSIMEISDSKDTIHIFAEPIYYEDIQKLLDSKGYTILVK